MASSVLDSLKEYLNLSQVPFAEVLVHLPDRVLNHCVEVLRAVDALLDGKHPIQNEDNPKHLVIQTLAKDNRQNRDLLRLVAVYHDLGKVISNAQHDFLGSFLFEALLKRTPREREALECICGFPPEVIGHLIRCHGRFGSLLTGEGSYLLFQDVLTADKDLCGLGCIDFLKSLFLLNIADIPHKWLTSCSIKVLCQDFIRLSSIAEHKNEDIEMVLEDLSVEFECERMCRLVHQGLRRGTLDVQQLDNFPEFGHSELRECLSNSSLRSSYAWMSFWEYALPFFTDLLAVSYHIHRRPETLAQLAAEVIESIVSSFSALACSPSGHRRIGLEFYLANHDQFKRLIVHGLTRDNREDRQSAQLLLERLIYVWDLDR